MTSVITTSGTVTGLDLGRIHRFAGIRYADAPTGDHRFRAPRPHRFAGSVDATRFGPTAPQPPSALETMLGGATEERSEDCLRLNVWTPSAQGPKRPVMVWIHGGAFMTGSGSSPLYDGSALCDLGDVVVVTLNYRLGPLGFLYLDDLDAGLAGSGNNGILDQQVALDWVAENIEAFGGDPQNVTIFGESAGAMSVITHVSLDHAEQRFHRAIAQSGGGHNAIPVALARSSTHRIMDAARVDDVAGLRRLDAAVLIAAAEQVGAQQAMVLDRIGSAREVGGHSMLFQPVIDGVVLDAAPVDRIGRGAGADIGVFIGVNADEWHLFDPSRKPIPVERLRGRLDRLAGGDGAELAAAYRADVDADATVPRTVQSAVMTDVMFRLPAIRLLEARAAIGRPGYHYQFSWPSPVAGGILGSCHALEIPFVFGTHDVTGISGFIGEHPPRELSKRMQQIWLHFARHGEPHPVADRFEPYTPERRMVYDFHTTDTVLVDPLSVRTQVWSGLL